MRRKLISRNKRMLSRAFCKARLVFNLPSKRSTKLYTLGVNRKSGGTSLSFIHACQRADDSIDPDDNVTFDSGPFVLNDGDSLAITAPRNQDYSYTGTNRFVFEDNQ